MPDEILTPTRKSSSRAKAPTAAELREFDASTVVHPFSTGMLPADERAEAEEAAAAASALVLKALLHRTEPETYPLPRDADSPEAAAVAALAKIDDRTFARMAPRVRALAADQARLARVLAPLGRKVDFKRPSLELERIRPAARLKKIVRVSVGAVEEEPTASRPVVVSRPAKYKRMDFVLRAVHCRRETSGGGSDEIVLGAVLVGASGNTKVVPAQVIGDFDDGTYVSTGNLPLGQFSLRTTDGYPKTMYCILQLVESDSDDAEVAQALTEALSAIATIAVSAVATPAAGAIAGALVNTIGAFIGIFISEDAFVPYGVMMRLDSEDEYGADGVSGKLHTDDIRGHGGAYRIGYRLVMNA